jgi:hypothetical protein
MNLVRKELRYVMKDRRVNPALHILAPPLDPYEAGSIKLFYVVRDCGWCKIQTLRYFTHASCPILHRLHCSRNTTEHQTQEYAQAVWV